MAPELINGERTDIEHQHGGQVDATAVTMKYRSLAIEHHHCASGHGQNSGIEMSLP
jgi:hypothetical protein